MTSAQLLTLLKDVLKADNDTIWTDAELYRYLTYAQQDIMAKMVEQDQNWFEATSSVDITSGTQEYSLPSDIFLGKVTVIEFIDRNDNYYPMEKIKKSKREVTNGTARFYATQLTIPVYYITGTKIGISPTPNETRTGAILITYIQSPSDIASNVQPTLPAMFHPLAAYRAAILAKGVKDDDDIENLVFVTSELETTLFRAFIDRATEAPT